MTSAISSDSPKGAIVLAEQPNSMGDNFVRSIGAKSRLPRGGSRGYSAARRQVVSRFSGNGVKYARRACVVRPRYVTTEHASGELRNEERFTDRVCASNNVRRADMPARLAITSFPFEAILGGGSRLVGDRRKSDSLGTETVRSRVRDSRAMPRVSLSACNAAITRARFRLMTGLCPGHPLLRRE